MFKFGAERLNLIDMFGLQPQSPHGPGAEYNQGTGNWDIDAVVIYGKMDWSGRLWFMNNRLKYLSSTLSYQPYSTSTSSSGGGGNNSYSSPSPSSSSFISRTLLHYMIGFGTDLKLTKEEFEYLLKKGEINFEKAKKQNDESYKAPINLYHSGYDLALSFGTATVNYTLKNGEPIYTGFRDRYDFDPKGLGKRAWYNEWITRLANKNIPGFGYEIKYP